MSRAAREARPHRSRAAAGASALASGEDLAALRRVREKLRAELEAVRRLLADGREGGAERLSLLAQGLEGRGHHASSLLLDELCLAVHAAGGDEGARDPVALAGGLDVLARLFEAIGREPGSPLAALVQVDALRAARGAELASASVPWEPEGWSEPAQAGIGVLARRLRPYLQKGLLGWLRSPGDAEALALFEAVFERLAQAAEAPRSAPALLAAAARAWVEHLRGVSAPGAVHRRLLGGFDRELRALGADEPVSPRVLRSVSHELLARRSSGRRARAVLDASGLERVEDLLPARRGPARRALAARLERSAEGVAARAETDRAGLLAELVAAADTLAFLGEGVARREVLVLASTLDEPGAGERLGGLAGALAGGSRARHVVAAPPGPGGDEGPAGDVIPAALLGDLHRAQNLIARLGDEPGGTLDAPDPPADPDDGEGPWLPPELQAVLESVPQEREADSVPEPTLDGIDLATLAERARGLLAEDADDATLAELRAEGLVLDDEALENLTAVAGAMGEAHSNLERRVGSLRERLGDMAHTIAGLRGQLERIGEPAPPGGRGAPAPAAPGVDDRGGAGAVDERVVAMSAGIEELATLHEAATRLTRETESLLVRQARDHVDLQRGLLRTRLVPVASRAAAWQGVAAATTGASVSIEGGDVRVDQGVLAGISPVVEALLRCLAEAGDAEEAPPLRVAALVAGDELHLELRGPPVVPAGAAIADAQAAMLELGGRLHHLEGDGSACVLALQTPLALPLRRVLTVESGGEVLAMPLDAVEGVVSPEPGGLAGEGEEVGSIFHAGREYPLARLDRMLGLSATGTSTPARGHVVFLRARGARGAVAVDSVRERNEVVARALDPQLAAISWLTGACIVGAERPVLILDPERLIGALLHGAWCEKPH